MILYQGPPAPNHSLCFLEHTAVPIAISPDLYHSLVSLLIIAPCRWNVNPQRHDLPFQCTFISEACNIPGSWQVSEWLNLLRPRCHLPKSRPLYVWDSVYGTIVWARGKEAVRLLFTRVLGSGNGLWQQQWPHPDLYCAFPTHWALCHVSSVSVTLHDRAINKPFFLGETGNSEV